MEESQTKVVKTEIPADQIPAGLRPHFQEYDPDRLDLEKDAGLIIQRALEFGTWEEVRWLFATVKSCIFPPAISSMPPFTLRRFTPPPVLLSSGLRCRSPLPHRSTPAPVLPRSPAP